MTYATMNRTPTSSSADWPIVGRTIDLDWSQVPLNWIHDDRFASHAINGLSYFLISAEFAMCRLCNEALPYIHDNKLREDVRGFIKQEASHARAHGKHLSEYMERHGIDDLPINRRSKWILEQLITQKPLGRKLPAALQKRWLTVRAGIFAAAEHYTTGLSDHLLNELSWESNGCDKSMASLIYWHAAEEIEHRTVMYDVYRALGGNLPLRTLIMGATLPGFLIALISAITEIGQLDPEVPANCKHSWQPGFWKAWQRSVARHNLPSPYWLIQHATSFIKPGYNPANEGSTEQALALLAQLETVSTKD